MQHDILVHMTPLALALILCDNDRSNLTTLTDRQPQSKEDIDNHKNIPSLPTGSTVAVQQEESRLQIHGPIIHKCLLFYCHFASLIQCLLSSCTLVVVSCVESWYGCLFPFCPLLFIFPWSVCAYVTMQTGLQVY